MHAGMDLFVSLSSSPSSWKGERLHVSGPLCAADQVLTTRAAEPARPTATVMADERPTRRDVDGGGNAAHESRLDKILSCA